MAAFCVNVLAAGQDGVSGAFSTRASSIDRLARAGSVIALRDGQPALAEAQVALGCRVAQVIEAPFDLIGAVEQVMLGQGVGALAYYERTYHHLGGAKPWSGRRHDGDGAPSRRRAARV
jgi:flavin reductase